MLIMLTGIVAQAQLRSPTDRFRDSIYATYKATHAARDIDFFLRDLKWPLDRLQRAERLLGGDAIRMAALFQDYSGILRLTDEDVLAIAPRTILVLGGSHRQFWMRLQPKTRELLFSNPAYLRKIITVLEGFDASPDAAAYKRIVTTYPDSLVFLHRLPSLLKVMEDRLPILLHFLQGIDFADEHREEIGSLDRFLAEWYRHMLPLYVANLDRYGSAPALAMWAAPEFFRIRGTDLREDNEWNQKIWPVLVGQMKFIRDVRRNSLDWPTESQAIADLITRRPSHPLDGDDWLDFLMRTGQTDGQAMRLLWEIRDRSDKLAQVDAFLAFLKAERIPYPVVLSMMKFANTGDDLLFLMKLSCDPLYGPDKDNVVKQAAGRIPLPIVQMSELKPHDRFIPMLHRHEQRMIAYLKDRKRGGTPKMRGFILRSSFGEDDGGDIPAACVDDITVEGLRVPANPDVWRNDLLPLISQLIAECAMQASEGA